MTEIAMSAHRLLEHGLTILLQSSLVLALGLLIGWRWRQHGPHFVSFVSRLSLVIVGMLAFFTIVLPPSTVTLFSIHLPSVSNHPAVPASQPVTPLLIPQDLSSYSQLPRVYHHTLPRPMRQSRPIVADSFLPAPIVMPLPSAAPPAPVRLPHPSLSYAAWVEISLAALWLLGTLGLFARIVFGQIFLWRISRTARPADPSVHRMLTEICRQHRIRPLRIRMSARVSSPFLAGNINPIIYLPETSFDERTLQAILKHEIAHRIRRDCAWQLAGQVVSALLWPQPLLWFLFQRAEQASEEVCDLAVVSPDCTPAAYAALLLELAERFTPRSPRRVLGAGIVPYQSALGRRIQTLLDRRLTIMTLAPHTRFGLTALLASAAFGSIFLVSTHAASPIHFSIFSDQKQMADKSMNNMHQMMLGVQEYAQDYDYDYPPARKWGTVIAPYLRPKDVAIFSAIPYSKDLHHDPLAPETQAYGYAFNQGLGSKKTTRLISPSTTVALFETTQDNFNATDLGQSVSHPGRLNSGNYYAFADGHVQWVSDDHAPSFKPNLAPHSIRPRPSNIALQADQGDTAKQAEILAELAKRQADLAAVKAQIEAQQAQIEAQKDAETQQQTLADKLDALAAARKALSQADIQALTEKGQLNEQQIDLLKAQKDQDLAKVQQQIAAVPLAKLDASKDLQYQILASRADATLNAAQGQQLAAQLDALQAQGDAANQSLQPLSTDQLKKMQDLQGAFKDNLFAQGKQYEITKKQYDALMKQYGKADLFSGKGLNGQDWSKNNYNDLKKFYGADVFKGKWPGDLADIKAQNDKFQKLFGSDGQLYFKQFPSGTGLYNYDLQYAPYGGLTTHPGSQKATIDQLLQSIQLQRQQLFMEQEELERLQQEQSANKP